MAECHPVAYRFVMEARRRGAKIIHVDPRFTRTSATANLYAPLRSGTDIVFLGGVINYILENEKYFKEYVQHYTNASFLVNPELKLPDDLDGLFSGYDPEKKTYDHNSWEIQREDLGQGEQKGQQPFENESQQSQDGQEASQGQSNAGGQQHERSHSQSQSQQKQTGGGERTGPAKRDMTMQDPNCVFQILKRHFSRYTPEMVERVCGTPKEVFLEVAKTIAANSGRDRTTAFCYAVGWTQHSVGVQMIRTAAILQLLLGNIGRPGGGILALRGHATIQGSTDVPTLYNLLPGYLTMPTEQDKEYTLADFIESNGSPTGWWHNMPKYIVSMLKAWYGEHATKETDFCFNYLPKVGGDYSYNQMFFRMQDSTIKGLFVMGENLGGGGPNARYELESMNYLDWCVVRDPYPVETGDFWRIEGLDPKKSKTEVFLMPASLVAEKEGSFTNTQRMIQWHDKAVDPPGDATSETWFLYYLGRRLMELYKDSPLERDKPMQQLQWELPIKDSKTGEPDLHTLAIEISGYTVADHKPVAGFPDLKEDGSTACGCWIYSGMVAPDGTNRAANRKADPAGVELGDPRFTNHSEWGFAWPANRRILYNRASADPDGKPWSERKKLIWWEDEPDGKPSGGEQAKGEHHGDETSPHGGKGRWVGYDVPDFPKEKAPNTPADPKGLGLAAHSGAEPFIMQADGVGRLYVAEGLVDGPLPTHYEPLESIVRNPLYPGQQSNPLDQRDQRQGNMLAPSISDSYPYVVTTYRLTEHHTSGAMSRWVPWLSELQPELFAEIDPLLAQEKGLVTGDWATLTTARGELEMRVLVTERIAPLRVDGNVIHQIGLPYHWSFKGIVTGDTVNNMTALTEEPNVHIHEAKVFTGNLRKGRKGAPVQSEPSSSDGVVVARGGEAGELAREVNLGLVDMMRHENHISADAGQSRAAQEASGQRSGITD